MTEQFLANLSFIFLVFSGFIALGFGPALYFGRHLASSEILYLSPLIGLGLLASIELILVGILFVPLHPKYVVVAVATISLLGIPPIQ